MSSRLLALLVGLALPAVAFAGGAPKMLLRLSNDYIQANDHSITETTLSLGGLEAGAAFYLTRSFALGASYHVNFDFTSKEIILHGLDLFSRFYFLGQGSRTSDEDSWGSATRRENVAWYVGAYLAERSYLANPAPGSTAATPRDRSSSLHFGASLGTDLRLSSAFDLNAELGAGLVTFSPLSGNFQTKTYRISLGIAYLF